jgi:hypothetical protein
MYTYRGESVGGGWFAKRAKKLAVRFSAFLPPPFHLPIDPTTEYPPRRFSIVPHCSMTFHIRALPLTPASICPVFCIQCHVLGATRKRRRTLQQNTFLANLKMITPEIGVAFSGLANLHGCEMRTRAAVCLTITLLLLPIVLLNKDLDELVFFRQ